MVEITPPIPIQAVTVNPEPAVQVLGGGEGGEPNLVAPGCVLGYCLLLALLWCIGGRGEAMPSYDVAFFGRG